jgi:hypothetical protein
MDRIQAGTPARGRLNTHCQRVGPAAASSLGAHVHTVDKKKKKKFDRPAAHCACEPLYDTYRGYGWNGMDVYKLVGLRCEHAW